MPVLWTATFMAFGFLAVYMVILRNTWRSFCIKKHDNPDSPPSKDKVSVIIAARNEANHLTRTLQAVLVANTTNRLQEIIVVDDHSEDSTRETVNQLRHPLVRCINVPEGKTGKKEALAIGIQHADSEIIAVTDADCLVGTRWLETIANAYEEDADLVMTTGLVLPESTATFLDRFQWLDFAATMALTQFGIRTNKFYLANGANMSFRKSAFERVGGYTGNDHIASGDDVFLIKKMAALPAKTIRFINEPESGVTTIPEQTWDDFWLQRKRWATKSKAYASPYILGLQSLAFILAFSILVFILLALFFHPAFGIPATVLFFGKFFTDFIFLGNISHSLQKKDAMKNFMTSYLLYLRYILIMGFHALVPSKTVWKGRPV